MTAAGILLAGTWWLRSSWGKDWLGERRVRQLVSAALEGNRYQALHNLTLPTPDGSTQIDHLILSRYGLFVLETKNLAGDIRGTAGQAFWIQEFPRQSFELLNPLRQNFKHLKTLETSPVKVLQLYVK